MFTYCRTSKKFHINEGGNTKKNKKKNRQNHSSPYSANGFAIKFAFMNGDSCASIKS